MRARNVHARRPLSSAQALSTGCQLAVARPIPAPRAAVRQCCKITLHCAAPRCAVAAMLWSVATRCTESPHLRLELLYFGAVAGNAEDPLAREAAVRADRIREHDHDLRDLPDRTRAAAHAGLGSDADMPMSVGTVAPRIRQAARHSCGPIRWRCAMAHCVNRNAQRPMASGRFGASTSVSGRFDSCAAEGRLRRLAACRGSTARGPWVVRVGAHGERRMVLLLDHHHLAQWNGEDRRAAAATALSTGNAVSGPTNGGATHGMQRAQHSGRT